MVNCIMCNKSRAKREAHLADEGYIECRATHDASALMRAFNAYASARRCETPFLVIGIEGHPGSAWPFQFQPESIAQCGGLSPITGSAAMQKAVANGLIKNDEND